MQPTLVIDGTKSSPEIILDPREGIFSFSGTSMSEDAVGFYMPIIDWLKKYALDPNPMTQVKFKMTYFNTASSKLLWEIMSLLQDIYSNGHKVKIDWIFQDEDEDMEEAGEIYAERMDIPINLIISED
ncbi:MAG: DUF1987 domain-containing protein [Salinivirgaceae bacterium]|jgi:hypothetical protein|nr:DUF1987 domain-containing protein [Salinivirgaceae bacterium]